jgi:peptidoglycan/LPS O-acetylase OafA/YrhL
VSGGGEFLRIRLFVFLGTISYSLYLVHQNLGYVVINQFYNIGLSPQIGISAALIVSVLTAYLLTSRVEKPSLSLIRNAYNNNEKIQKIAERLPVFFKR